MGLLDKCEIILETQGTTVTEMASESSFHDMSAASSKPKSVRKATQGASLLQSIGELKFSDDFLLEPMTTDLMPIVEMPDQEPSMPDLKFPMESPRHSPEAPGAAKIPEAARLPEAAKTPDFEMPNIEMPDFIMPDIEMPDIEMPGNELSDIAKPYGNRETDKSRKSQVKIDVLPQLIDIDINTQAELKPANGGNILMPDIIIPALNEPQKSNIEYVDRRQGPARSDRRRIGRATGGKNTLTVSELRKNFGKKEIVRGVGFSMKGGDVAGLLGPNGAGKTTIFYMIVGFHKPTTGDIKLDNTSIISGPMYRRARMGIAYLPQEASIFKKLTVEQNIMAILESRTDLNKKEKKERLEQLVDDFGIHRIRKQLGYTLSGGERRRTEIARALAIEPKFLLLDEPFAGIDPIAVFEIKQIIKHLSEEGIGILITDHNVRDTLEITTDAFIINRGLIVARGDRESILANQTVRDVYLGSDFKM